MRHPVVLRFALVVHASLAACDAHDPRRSGAGDAASPVDAIVDVDRCARDVVSRDTGPLCVPNATEPARSYDFAVTRFTIDDSQTPGPAARPVFGFDLDGAASPVFRPSAEPPHCTHGDFFSALDSDQNRDPRGRPCDIDAPQCMGAVDNQLPTLLDALRSLGSRDAGVDPRVALNAAIAHGAYAMLIRVSDVNGPLGPSLCDPSVIVRAYRGVPLAQRCASHGVPDQSYGIAASSLRDPSDATSAHFTFPGAIIDGRLRVFPRSTSDPNASLTLPFTFFGNALPLAVHNTVLRINLNADGSATDGNLGGFIRSTALVRTLVMVRELAQFESSLPVALDGFNDIALPLGDPCGSCGYSPNDGGIGIGLGFTAIRAVITDTIIATPPDAPCAP